MPGRAATREDHRLAPNLRGPKLDQAVCAAAGQPPVLQHRQRYDLAAVRGYFLRLVGKALNGLGPELDRAIVAAAGQPPVLQRHHPADRAAVPEDRDRLPRTLLAPEFDRAVVVAATGQPPVRQHRQRHDLAAPVGQILMLGWSASPPLASRPSGSTASPCTCLPLDPPYHSSV